MKNKFILISIIFFSFNYSILSANEKFNFDITEIEISNDGNFFKGLKRGTATTNNNQTIITADIFEFNKIKNILTAIGNVIIEDKVKDYIIKSNHIIYLKNEENIISKGDTTAIIQSKYDILSSDINLDRNRNILSSDKKTSIFDDEFTNYTTDFLHYEIDKNIFKGVNIKIFTNINKNKNEKELYIFKDGIFDLKNKEFIASDTEIYVKKNIFDQIKNDPRIFGKSSKKKDNITKINKGIFTSCELGDGCPPWSIKAKNITHDEKKKILYMSIPYYEFMISQYFIFLDLPIQIQR